MISINTTDLTGPALRYAVAMIEYPEPDYDTEWRLIHIEPDGDDWCFQPDVDWAQGGPIIEREGLALSPTPDGTYRAYASDGVRWVPRGELGEEVFNWTHKQVGPTALTAAMRCFVATRLGDTVEVPEELL